jgi:hypothetical protein
MKSRWPRKAHLQRSVSDSHAPLPLSLADIFINYDLDIIADESSDSHRLEIIRSVCSSLGYPSILAATLADVKSMPATELHLPTVRTVLDEICRAYHERRAFEGFPKEVEKGLGQGAVDLSRPVLEHEFEKLRKLGSLNRSHYEQHEEHHISFDMTAIYQEMSESSPNLIRLLSGFLGGPNEKYNDTERRIVMVAAMLAQVRNPHTNYLQGIFGIFLFASKTPKRIITALNKIGVSTSYKTILRHLKVAATIARNKLMATASKGNAFVAVFDNLTFMARVRDVRLDNLSEFLTWTAGYVLIPPASRSYPMFTHEDIDRTKIAALNLYIFLPTEQDHENLAMAYRAIIGQAVVQFGDYHKVAIENINCDLPTVFRIDPSEAPEILTLPTYDLNEAVRNDMIQIMYSIQRDTGLSDEQCVKNQVLFGGDLMTVDGIR